MNRLLHALTLFRLLALANAQNAACLAGQSALSSDNALSQADLLMNAGYPELPQASDPIMVNTTLNWAGVSSTNLYNRMRNECEANDGHKLCTVRTKVKFAQEIAGQEGVNYVTEESKPVCFPPKCTDDDVKIVEAEPGRCNPSSPVRACEILGYDVECPADRPTETGTCAQTLNTLTSPFFIQRNLLEGRVRAGCPQNVAVAGSTNLCEVTVGTLEIKSIRDYSAKERDQYYQDFKKQCYASGGKVCEANTNVRQKAERDGVGEVFFARTYVAQPVCMADECTGNDESKAIVKAFGDSVTNACNLDDGSCVVNVRKVDCGLTSAPTTQAQRKPTAAPTEQKVSDVCRDATAAMDVRLATTNAAMLVAFPEVVEQSSDLVVTTVQHWDQINDNIVYTQMKNECEAKGFVMCKAITKVKFSEQIAGFQANNTITERNKPVCYPPTCKDDDLLTLEPNPGRCNPDVLPCTIGDFAVRCPDDRQVLEGTCTQTMDTVTDPFFLARNILESRIQASCISGGGGRFCTINYDDVDRVTTRDFAGHETAPTYQAYEEDCLSNGGRVCRVDMFVQTTGETVDTLVGLTVRTMRTLLEQPVCVNNRCVEEELKEVVMRGVPGCDITDGSCVVTIASMDCDEGRPTTSPVPTASPTVNPVSDKCLSSSRTLGQTVAVANAAFQAGYPDVPDDVDPVAVDTVHNWDQLKDRFLYGRLKNDCESQAGHVMCTVDTSVRFEQTVGDVVFANDVKETNKPVCFPPSCADSEIAVVEPNPGRCAPDVLPCKILGYAVNCPDGRQVDTTATCAATLDPLTSGFFVGRNVLEGQIQASCATGGSTICSVDSGDVKASTTRDFTGHETDNGSYETLETECLTNGGRVCRVDFTVAGAGETPDVFGVDLEVVRKRVDMPICLSTTCSGDDEMIAVVKSRIPACEGSGCQVDVTRIECDAGLEPTKSPAPTNAPVVSRKCRTANDELRLDTVAENAGLLALYQDVPETDEPVGLELTLNWDEVADSQFYERMKNGCANQAAGNTVCTVDTSAEFFVSIEGRNITRKVVEKNKPVCFPKACDGNSVAILEPNPGRCNPDSDLVPCTVGPYEVACPADKPTNSKDGTCSQDLTATDPYFINRNLLEVSIYSNCATDGNECTVEANDVVLKSSADFTDAESVYEYDNFKNKCDANGRGQICRADMVVRTEIVDDELLGLVSLPNDILRLSSERTYTEYPVCVSLECGGPEIPELIRTTLPGCLAGACEVDVTNLECDVSLFPPTASPEQAVDKDVAPTVTAPTEPTTPTTPTAPTEPVGEGGGDATSSGFSPAHTLALTFVSVYVVVLFTLW